MQSVSTADLAAAVSAFRDELEFEVRAEGEVGSDLAEALGVAKSLHSRFVVMGAWGTSRGHIRLIEGPADDVTETFHKRGLFNAELLTRDVEALHERLKASAFFRVVSDLNTYDLSGAGGGAISRSFATRGPGGAGFFFTQYLKVPPPRVLPVCETLVGPMFNAALSTTDQARVEMFYESVLGLGRRLAGRLTQPSVNRIIGLPDDWGFMMLVYKGAGDGLIEVDIHEHDVPPEPELSGDQLRPGNSFLSLETPELDQVIERARLAGFRGTGSTGVAAWPYEGRRASTLWGPAGERVELIEARLTS